MDFVHNHWSSRHETFQDAISDPAVAIVIGIPFTIPDDYRMFFKVKEIAQINLRNKMRGNSLIVECYWLDFGVDGLRIDYAIGPTPDFWQTCGSDQGHQPDCWIFGEVIDPPDSPGSVGGVMDGCLDFHCLSFCVKPSLVRSGSL